MPRLRVTPMEHDALAARISNLAMARFGSFEMTITAGSASVSKEVTYSALPSGKTYKCVAAVNSWISPHEAKPVLTIRSQTATKMDVHASIPVTRTENFSFVIGYIVFAF